MSDEDAREMTLLEWVSQLPKGHRAHREYDALLAQSAAIERLAPTPAAPAGSGAERRIDAMLADLVERRAIGVIGPLDELLDAIVAQRARAEAAERERDTISCNAIPTWPACEDGLDRQQHNDPVCWGCYSAEKAIRREVESQLSAATAREAGLRELAVDAIEAFALVTLMGKPHAAVEGLRARLASLAAPEGGTSRPTPPEGTNE